MSGFIQSGRFGGAAWSPLDLSGLALWLDASDGGSFTFSSGSLVAQWDDLSGNGRHFTQSNASYQPSRTGSQNGLPTVEFRLTGTNYMNAAVFSPSRTAITIVGVANPRSSTRSRLYFSLGSDQHMAISHSTEGAYKYGGLLGSVSWLHTSTTGDAVGPCSVGIIRRSGGSNTVRRNGIDLTVTTGGSHTPNAASGYMWLGGDGAPSKLVDVDIAEILVYDGVSLSGSDLTDLESYLNAKWAVY